MHPPKKAARHSARMTTVQGTGSSAKKTWKTNCQDWILQIKSIEIPWNCVVQNSWRSKWMIGKSQHDKTIQNLHVLPLCSFQKSFMFLYILLSILDEFVFFWCQLVQCGMRASGHQASFRLAYAVPWEAWARNGIAGKILNSYKTIYILLPPCAVLERTHLITHIANLK